MIENININPRTEELKTEFSNMIWKMATNLVHGGKVNPVQFMDYTLGGLFYRFISENITDYCNQLMRDAGVENADYAHMSDLPLVQRYIADAVKRRRKGVNVDRKSVV